MAEPQPHLSTITMNLPQDIIFYNILPRFPAKSLLRFKSVSKQWHSFIKTPLFEKLHLHHVTNDHHQYYHKLVAWSKKTPSVFHTIDCEVPEDGLTVGRPLPFEVLPENMSILTSFGGLLCVGITKYRRDMCGYEESDGNGDDICEYKYSDLILWNPLTGDYKTLSKPHKSHYKCYWRPYGGGRAFGLYYSSRDDDYKLLRVTYDCYAYLYSLKCDAWKKIDSSTEYLKPPRIAEYWLQSTVVNEKIYILNYHFERLNSIIMFHTQTEKFTEVSTPPLENRLIYCIDFMVLRGYIHLYVIYGDYRSVIESDVEFWRLDDGDANWKKVVTYHMPNTRPLHLMRDGNWLTKSDYGSFVYKMDLARNIKIFSVNTDQDMRIPLDGKYIETLVSPSR